MDDPENKDLCIIDRKETTQGYKVKEDFVIKTIRDIKKRFGKLKNNRLYVCPEHLEQYKKKRKNYERIVLLVSGLVILMFLVGIVAPLFSGRINFAGFISLIIIVFVMGFFLISMHIPAIETDINIIKKSTQETQEKAPKNQTKEKTKNKENKKLEK